jgi:methylamine---glutamate N-methyltransferase subunit A
MCGIVGLFCKRPSQEHSLGALLEAMLDTMRDRGPDSAGFAVYRQDGAGSDLKLTVRAPSGVDPETLAATLEGAFGGSMEIVARATHAVVHLPAAQEAAFRAALLRAAPGFTVVGAGRRIELYKDLGLPAEVTGRFGLGRMTGTHGIGHTRMATESAVTIDGAHPYTSGHDICLVHNGSLSNHNALRRMLMREGLQFETENDTEVAAGYIAWRLREGDDLPTALEACLRDLDGFYTFVVGTETGFAVLRDPISCKPAVMAETDDWVAFGSEYRALVGLPGIDGARVWEPEPARVYAWDRAAA